MLVSRKAWTKKFSPLKPQKLIYSSAETMFPLLRYFRYLPKTVLPNKKLFSLFCRRLNILRSQNAVVIIMFVLLLGYLALRFVSPFKICRKVGIYNKFPRVVCFGHDM